MRFVVVVTVALTGELKKESEKQEMLQEIGLSSVLFTNKS